MSEPKLSEKMESLLRAMMIVAKSHIEAIDSFDPFGLVVDSDNAHTFVDVEFSAPQWKGSDTNQRVRAVQDGIWAIQLNKPLTSAAILWDVNLRPQEGGPATPAILGWLEERPGVAIQMVYHYEMQNGKVVMGRRDLNPKAHTLLKG